MDARRIVAVIVIAVLSACALPAAAAAQTASCSQETKRLNTFKRGMKAAKRKYFRTHRSARARKKFVRRQNQKLVRLRRARRRCLNRPAPPQPSPSPAPSPSPVPSPPPFVADDVVSAAAVASPTEISTDGDAEVIRTQLELDLRTGAAAADVEALLRRLDARIVSSLRGVGQLTVRIPDPGSLAALDALIAGLAGDPALDGAERAVVPVAEELPEFILPGAIDEVRPQLAVRAHALWNARAALTGASRPSLVVGDYFGAGPPGASVAVTASGADFATGNPHLHGYLILGLLAGTFDPVGLTDAQADHVTGLWAGPPLRLHAVDLRIAIGGSTFQDRLVNLIRSVPGNVVLSTSIGDGCAQTTGCSFIDASDSGEQWVEKVRAFNLDSRVVHASAGGNVRAHLPTHTDARLNSGFNAAALLTMSGGSLRNTLVVENAIASSPLDAVRPMCLNQNSKRGGQIAAVGTDVTSLDGPDSGVFVAGGGTSSATPQVAAAAATVWALDPSLSPTEVVSRLLATARPATGTTGDARCSSVPHAPALDAYGAVLAADDPTAAPAREAVLDPVNANGEDVFPGNGRFDEKDLEAFVAAFEAANGDIDYGRYDLNGDGRTGGGTVDRVDLDASSPPAWDFSERRDVLGLQIGHVETELTDLDVLCHEAAGPLYVGDEEAREQFFEDHCLPPVTLDVAFPSAVEPGESNTLLIGARRTDVSEPDDALPGVHLDLTVEGGSVDALTGSTDENGDFTTSAQLFAGQGALRIEIVARAGDGGPELTSRTVIAQVVADGSVQVLDQLGYLDVGARAIGDGEELSDSDHDEGPSVTFSYNGSANASVGGASGSVQAQGTASLVTDGASLTLTTGGRFRGHASADGSTFTEAGAGGTVYAYIEFEITGGPMKLSVSGTPRSNCDLQVHSWDNSSTPTSPLQPGHYYYEGVCFGGVGLDAGSAEFDVETSSELRIFR